MDATLAVYLIYGMVSIGLTIWLARTFYTNGTVFLRDVFEGKEEFSAAVNRMLVVGFYMLNLGYALTIFNQPKVADATEAGAVLVEKLGLLLLALGVIHFLNMLVFFQIRKRHRLESAPVPVEPQAFLRPPEGDPFPA